jgi:hypothetical protein
MRAGHFWFIVVVVVVVVVVCGTALGGGEGCFKIPALQRITL